LEAVAERYSTVVIGPPYGNEVGGNCINLGVRTYSELPRYYNNLDVGLIPFSDFEVAKAANPVKMYEYLAAGKPVVATTTSETSLYPEFVLTATNADGFLNQIERALSLPGAAARRAFARQHSWAARFAEIEPVLLSHLGE
jgi:glycosyltransferase involved in cell wall biosynthesis